MEAGKDAMKECWKISICAVHHLQSMAILNVAIAFQRSISRSRLSDMMEGGMKILAQKGWKNVPFPA